MSGSWRMWIGRGIGIGAGAGLVAASLVACTGELGTASSPATSSSPPGTHPPSGSDIPPCSQDPDWAIGGDPSARVECPAFWDCETIVGARKRCTNPGPDSPGAHGNWECRDQAGTTICTGSDTPDMGGGAGWSCVQSGDAWVCTSNTPSYPPTGELPPGAPGAPGSPGGDIPGAGGSSSWDCYFVPGPDGPARVCESRTTPPDSPSSPSSPSTPSTPPGEDAGTPTPPAPPPPPPPPPPPETPAGPPGCTCLPGANRWCDTPSYCSWGKETCGPDGQWGRCIEASPPSVCAIIAGEYYDPGCCLLAGECCQNYPGDDSIGDCASLLCR